MSYLARLKRGKRTYYYLVENIRVSGQQRRQVRQYVGTQQPSENRLRMLFANFEKKVEAEKMKRFGSHYLTMDEIKEIDQLNSDFQSRYQKQNKAVQDQFDQNFVLAFVYNTNSIEGSTLTPKEVALLLGQGIAPSKPIEDVLEAKNAQAALEYVKQYSGDLSEKFLLEIHQKYFFQTMPYIAGKYKTKENRVHGSSFDTTPPHLVPSAMKEFMQEYQKLKKELHPLELSAWVHWKITFIHPFQDGNGRIARLVMNFVLHKNGYALIDIKTKEKHAYFKALERSNYAENGAALAVRLVKHFKKQYRYALAD